MTSPVDAADRSGWCTAPVRARLRSQGHDGGEGAVRVPSADRSAGPDSGRRVAPVARRRRLRNGPPPRADRRPRRSISSAWPRPEPIVWSACLLRPRTPIRPSSTSSPIPMSSRPSRAHRGYAGPARSR